MRKSLQTRPTVFLSVLTSSLILSACGGGGELPVQSAAAFPSPEQMMPEMMSEPTLPPASTIVVLPSTGGGGSRKATANVVTIDSSGKRVLTPVTPVPTVPSVPAEPVVIATTVPALTDVRLESTGSTEQVQVPVTFGHVFAPGHVATSQTITGRLADGSSAPLQFDVKARHPDGSVRHAIISTVLPRLASGTTESLGLVVAPAAVSAASAVSPSLLGDAFSAAAHVTINGVRYSASADQLLRSGRYSTWLSGSVVNEWHVSAPLTSETGAVHPHLAARFAVRAYNGQPRVRIDVTIENNWAFEAAPQNFTYDALVEVNGAPVYTKAAMEHFHHARWRKVFWAGAAPQLHVKHNTAYLIDSKALPNYDRGIVFPETALAGLKTGWTGAKTEPMGVGMANPYMPSTGGRNDIGLLPGWAATYLLSMDKRAWEVTSTTADLAGSWSMHYRDKITDRPVSLANFPYMTVLGRPGDTLNPLTKRYEAFPTCATSTACTKVASHDTSHQPGFSYLPYLVTGDYYHLEELQFWTNYNSFVDNPAYRMHGQGLFKADQVRAQAWSMRTLAQAAYITPDNDSFKSHFTKLLTNNLDYYNTTYSTNPAANVFGVLTNGYSIVYNSATGLAPWMDDFFTAAIGHAAELGFDKANALLAWKAKFPIQRMNDPAACWIDATIYNLKVRDSQTSPLYTSFAQAYKASHTAAFNLLPCASSAMATAMSLKIGEMSGYSATPIGYPSNLQPALAYAATVGGAEGLKAWNQFMLRSVKPNYALGPQFAVVPR